MKFTLATCVRNEGPYLLEWVAHYKLLGFDRIVIFSNDNTDGSDELLTQMEKEQLIEWRPRTLAPGESPQLSAFDALSKELFSNANEHGGYLVWLDCDEFLILKRHASIQELLSFYNFPDALYLNWKHFGSSQALKYERELTVLRFLGCNSTTHHNRLGKCISRIAPKIFTSIINHRPIPIKKHTWGRIIYAGNPLDDTPVAKEIIYGANPKKNESAPVLYDVCHLNHYAIRSQEEYSWKSKRGNGWQPLDGTKAHFLDSYFYVHDLNNEQDNFAAEKYAHAIKNYLAQLSTQLLTLQSETIDKAIENHLELETQPLTISQTDPWLALIQQQGLDIEKTAKRLNYGSFVGDNLNYVFVETPKAACSTLKWVIADLENRQVNPKQSGQESSTSMVIHGRSSHGVKNLMHLSIEERLGLLTQNDVVRFCVVRNPYARIVSAWADKIRQKEPGYEKIWEEVARHCGTNPQVCPTFSEFVQWMVEKQNVGACNAHWRGMVYLLLPELLNYTHVLHTENLVSELQQVLDKIAPQKSAKTLLEHYRINESLPVDWQTFYDEELAIKIASFYEKDFQQYGYPLDSWKINTQVANVSDELELLKKKFRNYEVVALEAIRSRNETISELIKKNPAPDKKNPKQKKILVLGDSHVHLFSRPGWSNLTPNLQWQVVSVQGATLSGLENPNSKTQAGAQFDTALSQNSSDVVLLCLGEVDTGFVIWFRAERDGINIQEAAKRAVDNYCRLIETARQHSSVVVLSTPLPTLLDDETESSVAKARAEVKASLLERTELTCWFNTQIADWCRKHNVSYVNLDSQAKGADGLVDNRLRHSNPKDHHYNPVYYRKLLVKHLLPVIRKLVFTKG